MSRDTETAYIGRANTIKRVLQKQGAVLTEAERLAITRVQAKWGTWCIDTDVGADPIEYDSSDGAVRMQIGLVPGLTVGRYDLTLTCFDAATPEGFAWGGFRLTVVEWTVCDV